MYVYLRHPGAVKIPHGKVNTLLGSSLQPKEQAVVKHPTGLRFPLCAESLTLPEVDPPSTILVTVKYTLVGKINTAAADPTVTAYSVPVSRNAVS